ncbi:MAG: PDZ domain-containing protein [Gemmatimonadales bacterium]
MTSNKWIAGALALLAALPMAAAAQEEPPRPPRVDVAPHLLNFHFNRGRLGIVVQTRADAQNDKIGARIEAVTPGAPADKAGLKAGDIITRVNGIALAKTGDGDSQPGTKLVRLAQALDPGDTVRVEYRRGNEPRTATLVAEDVATSWDVGPMVENVRRFMVDSVRGHMMDSTIRLHLDTVRFRLDEIGPGFAFAFGSPWGQLDLVRLNPDLGEYFGTQEGVLVVRVPGEGELPLKGGDVILAIDGRKPTSPAHAMRILRSYAEGETVKIEILRKRSRSTVTWSVPEREERVRGHLRRAPRGEQT